MNELRIQIPEGMMIDEENSTFECIKFKPKGISYEDIAENLFKNRSVYFINIYGEVVSAPVNGTNHPNNALSRKQCERLLAINQLMNVAYYFNEVVDKTVTPTNKWVPEIDLFGAIRMTSCDLCHKNDIVWFKTRESLRQAVKILGEETVKLAISL